MEDHIIYNLTKYAIPYEYKTKRSIRVAEIDIPTILWLRFIFKGSGTLDIYDDKLTFKKDKQYFNILRA